jgi:divalent metal cation (Fe/Co/Zn/Cd) transporter
MPILARAKRRVARTIASKALAADAKQTELCMYLSAILLGGLILNATFDWWWADPAAGLLMIPIIVREGINGLKGQSCCDDCSG